MQSFAQNNVPPAELQIKMALMAAPADKRDSAMVYGYAENKELVVLRKGLNEFICLSDDPGLAGFSVACYHRNLEPFMQRGRELKKQGKAAREIFDTREKEVKAGTLIMPKQPATLYVYSTKQDDYNSTTGEIKKRLPALGNLYPLRNRTEYRPLVKTRSAGDALDHEPRKRMVRTS